MRRNRSRGLVDRRSALRFSFDGQPLTGYAGDTLASALLASGVSVLGRSFKYHRPRGLLAAGVEEPNALMQLGEGARQGQRRRGVRGALGGAAKRKREVRLGLRLFGLLGHGVQQVRARGRKRPAPPER